MKVKVMMCFAGRFEMKKLLILIILFISVPVFASGTHRVLHVVDGDTLRIDYNGKPEKVRLIGIDTPESGYNNKTIRDSERTHEDIDSIIKKGRLAADFVKSLVKIGDFIRLEFDAQERDRYGRLLAYVFLKDGRMLNDMIVRSGYASVMTIPPNVKYASLFRKSYRYAREKKIGLWER